MGVAGVAQTLASSPLGLVVFATWLCLVGTEKEAPAGLSSQVLCWETEILRRTQDNLQWPG